MNASRSKQSTGSLSNNEVKALEEEVESLYSEILPVAQMSIEQQYLEPALKAMSSKGAGGIQKSVAAVTYVSLVCQKSDRPSTLVLTVHTDE